MARRRALAVLAVGLLASACGSIAGPGAPVSLDGRAFLSTLVLEDGVERSLLPGTRVEVSFTDGRLSAAAGCNLMGAEYEIVGDVLELVGDVSTTEIGCDPARHEQDEWVSGLLGGSPQVVLDGAELRLIGGGVEIQLLDREVADPDRPLVGTTWRLETIIEGGVASSVNVGTSATLRFPDERSVEVDAGCNRGGGPAEITADTLVIGPLGLTARGCQGPAAELERIVLAVLLSPEVRYSIEGTLLSIRAGDLGLDWRA